MGGLGRSRKLIIVALLALLVIGAVVLALRLPAIGRVEVLLPTPGATQTPAPLRVYVCGAVARADVYTLPAGSIIKDAIQAAGGATAEADLTRINLALALEDQEQVYVPARGEPASAAPTLPSKSAGAPGRINLNTASLAELDTLPGIGPALAQRIVDHRPYRSAEELLEVAGIGPATYEKLKDKVTAP